MTHEHAWTLLPDLLADRDQPELLAHVAACHDCQRRVFLLGRADRALRGASAARGKEQRRLRRRRGLRFASGSVAAAAAVLVVVLVLPRPAAPHRFTLRTAQGRAIGHAILSRSDAANTSLTLVARGLPARRGAVYLLWASGEGRGATTIGRFMVNADGTCRARFNLPGGRWARFWVTRPDRPRTVVATT